MKEHQLTVSRTASYFISGEPGSNIKRVWFVCHGYGQLAAYFIRNFKVIDDGSTLVVAPEALSRFYINGTSGRVGASWMTRENRLLEISDYTNYLDTLAAHIMQQLPPDVKICVLGFSQGAATASRWVAAGQIRCHALVLWAGVFPPDIDAAAIFNQLNNTPVVLAAGRTDQYITEQAATAQHQMLLELGIKAQLHWYDGGHSIQPELLLSLHQKLASI